VVNTLAPSFTGATAEVTIERSVRRRIGVIWALLFFSVLTYSAGLPMLITIPSTVGKVMTQGALWVALLLALTLNRRIVIRPNAFLLIFTLLAALSLLSSVRTFHLGSTYRAVRLIGFLATLWLLTPWWGRKDMLLLRCQLRCLVVVIFAAAAGIVISPHKALQSGRLYGIIWPIYTTQLAHYAAVAAGLGAVLWLCGLISRNRALLLEGFSVLVLLLTHTRTALVAMLAAITVAALSLFFGRRRVRRVVAVSLAIAAVVAVAFLPTLVHWFQRGETGTSFTDLSGRTLVWHQLLNFPRSKPQELFGFGLSNTSFQGFSIDDSWLAIYQDQGLVGDILVGLLLLALWVSAITRPRGPSRALVLFILTYCVIASYTEVGLGDASTYILDLAVAASLLAPPAWSRPLERAPAS
jgi:O-antigen ligase